VLDSDASPAAKIGLAVTKRRRALARDFCRADCVRAGSLFNLRDYRVVQRRVADMAAQPNMIAAGRRESSMDWEDEETWLRAWIVRLRTIWRFSRDSRVDVGLREFIAAAEARLDMLQSKRLRPLETEEPPGG
jgi:hypothetical protein